MFELAPKRAALFESFERGLPEAWTATGLWRVNDVVSEPGCGSARSGVNAAAFNDQCRFPGLVTGTLSSPVVSLPAELQGARLSFSHWSETEREPGRDFRRVLIEVDGTELVPVAEWSGQDHGSRDRWAHEALDIAQFAGRNIRVVFEFETVDEYFNDYAGWLIDDVEVVF